MAAGFTFQGSCFATADAARGAHCQVAYPLTAADGSVLVCTATTETGLSLLRTDTAGGSTSLTVATSYVACDTEDVLMAVPTPELAFKATAWGWSLVVACFLVSWSVKQVLDAIHNSRAPSQ